jgi:hypothetical protein
MRLRMTLPSAAHPERVDNGCGCGATPLMASAALACLRNSATSLHDCARGEPSRPLTPRELLLRMDTSRQHVAAAFPPMQQRAGLRSRAGGRSQLVQSTRDASARVGKALWAETLGPEGSDGATYLESIGSNTRAMADGVAGGRVSCSLPADSVRVH